MRHLASMIQVQVLVISVPALEMTHRLTVLGHLQADYWLKMLQYFCQLSLDLCLFLCYLCGMDDLIQYGRRDTAKISRHFDCK